MQFSTDWTFSAKEKELHTFLSHDRWKDTHIDTFRTLSSRGNPVETIYLNTHVSVGKYEINV